MRTQIGDLLVRLRSGTIGSLTTLVAAGIVLAVLLSLPSRLNTYQLYLVGLVLVYSIANLGFSTLIGWSGQLALAHAGFFGVGAYITSYAYQEGLPFVVGMLIGAVVAAVAGMIVAAPAVQLRGFFLAIATLAFGQLLVRLFVELDEYTGGGAGMTVPLLKLGDRSPYESLHIAIAITAVLYFLLTRRMLRGRFGRTLQGLRDIEIAVGTLGISPMRYKLVVFMFSAASAAIAGSFFAQLQGYLSPDMFDFPLQLRLLIMVLIGGVASVWGPVLGAIFLVFVTERLQEFEYHQRLALGLALVVVVAFLPQGIASLPAVLRRTWQRVRRGSTSIPMPPLPEHAV